MQELQHMRPRFREQQALSNKQQAKSWKQEAKTSRE
jgi:hypothetical protein